MPIDRSGGASVLLVEDDRDDAELALRVLRRTEKIGRVHHVTDGAATLAYLFREEPYGDLTTDDVPDLVFLDLSLPRVNGLDVLRRVKRDHRTRSVPVVVWTSSRHDRDRATSYELGVNSYVVKPVGFARFAEVLLGVVAYWTDTNEPPPRRHGGTIDGEPG